MPVVVTVDGCPLSDPRLGRNVIALAPGRHRLQAHVRYWFPRQMGPADYDADVVAGEWAAIEYKAPLWALAKGAMGPPPQRYHGLVAIVALLALSAIFAVLMLVLAL